MKNPVPYMRGDQLYIRRRVPRRYSSVEPRAFIHIALATDSLSVANQKAPGIWDQMIDAWEAMLEGRGKEGGERMQAAQRLAKRRGYRYLDAPDVAKLPIDEIIARLSLAFDSRDRLNMAEAEAALGLVPDQTVTVEQAYDDFYKVAGDRVVGKSPDQLRRHRAPRLKATINFIDVVGNKSIGDITTDDMFAFRAYWLERVAKGDVKPESANKDFTYLIAMWKAVARSKSIKLLFDTGGLSLSGSKGKKAIRPPFSNQWIKDKLLAPGALQGLNTEARLIIIGMINTGYRPSEGAGLLQGEIRLDGEVPHIIIQPNDNRQLKNRHSERYIPLTGCSLEAFRQAPSGFPRYAQNNASLSATVNKFLRENKLIETPDHSFYGLRHSFEDRLLEAHVDERIRSDLLGHGLKRERYGKGGDMKFVHDIMVKFAI